MKRKSKHFWLVLNVLLLTIFFPTTALAYFDPGTGSMILQMLGVAFIAAGGFFVAFKHRIRAFFNKRKKNEAGAEDTAKPVTPSDNKQDDAK
ncbi:hypothetical protein LJC33_00215 [Eubacteriales bacterium OttesenSCG-928-N13]|nr:hypothetical protein [Eubacteriales bacterium OttesenSCG-928-N13]